MNYFLPFALPDIDKEEITEVVISLQSGWLTTGGKTKQFEQEFAEFLGDHHLVAHNANLEAIGVSSGDEVITTPYTFTATAEVIRYLGANPVFVDIDTSSFNIDTNKIEKAITPKTKAIIPVHFGGLSCDMNPILEIAKTHNLAVIEDAAHAIPTTYHGKLIGSLNSHATVYSFYATKPIATGEGGMLVTRNSEIAQRCRTMRLHGISRDAFDRYTSTKPSWYYEVVAPGFKYNMTDIAASLGIHQLRKVWKFQEKRSQIAEYYNSQLSSLPLLLPPKAPNDDIHSWHLYVIRLDETANISRDEFIQQMTSQGIGCSVHYIPLHLHPYWRDTYGLKPEDYPKALATYKKAVSLPIYTKMIPEDQERVVKSVKAILLK